MFADLVDSTAMAEALGGERNVAVLRSHDRLARDLLRKFGGVEIKKSDGFLFMFESPVSAVHYALAYHAALAELARDLDAPIKCRVGIHHGEVFILKNAPEDIKLGAQPQELEGLAIINGLICALPSSCRLAVRAAM